MPSLVSRRGVVIAVHVVHIDVESTAIWVCHLGVPFGDESIISINLDY
jgi:hypothetical protein